MSEATTTPNRTVNYTLGPIYDFLAQKLPDCRTERGLLDITALASSMGLSEEAIYKCFRKNRLTIGVARKLVEIGKGKIKQEELTSFILA